MTVRWKKHVFGLLFIGFLFSIFHDFVFYNVDPCLKKVDTVIKFENGQINDPLCKIHHSLHMTYIMPSNIYIEEPPIENIYLFTYKKPILEEYPQDIFKPPTLA
jgi:hypothetical protein